MLTNPTGTNVFHRSLHNELPRAVRAEGNYIYDKDGRKFLDGSCGAGVSSIGHGDKRVITGITDQLQTLDYVFCGTFSNNVSYKVLNIYFLIL
jgi:adenosylmethionine-8-amino-7-oxononanoate aminotransferase